MPVRNRTEMTWTLENVERPGARVTLNSPAFGDYEVVSVRPGEHIKATASPAPKGRNAVEMGIYPSDMLGNVKQWLEKGGTTVLYVRDDDATINQGDMGYVYLCDGSNLVDKPYLAVAQFYIEA